MLVNMEASFNYISTIDWVIFYSTVTHQSQPWPEFVVFKYTHKNDTKWGMKCKNKSRYAVL